jgi:isocitrate/isopropylmalate dehydrogenase
MSSKPTCCFRDVCIAEAKHVGIPWNDRYIECASVLDLLLHPAAYDVIVPENMFGDILSDRRISRRRLGMLPSANNREQNASLNRPRECTHNWPGKISQTRCSDFESAAMLLDYIGDPSSQDEWIRRLTFS